MLRVGHYPWTPDRQDRKTEAEVVAALGVRGLDDPAALRLASNAREPQGNGAHYQSGGWSGINFWDRGADGRFACNSWFCVEGEWTADEVIEHARRILPPEYWTMRPGLEFDIK